MGSGRYRTSDEEDAIRIGCGLWWFCVFVISVSLTAASYRIVQTNHVGLDFNIYTRKIDVNDDGLPYSPGRYFAGFGHRFRTYPTNFQEIFFKSMDVWTAEGQKVLLDVSFQYELDRANIMDLYLSYTTNYNSVVSNIVTESIKQTTVDFTTVEFFSKRREITWRIKRNIREEFSAYPFFLRGLQLREINIPDNFEAKVTSKVVVQQGYFTALAAQSASVLRAEATVIMSGAYAAANNTVAQANSDGQILISQNKNLGRQLKVAAQADMFSLIASTLDFSQNQTLRYVWIRTFKARAGRDKLVSVSNPWLQVSL